MSQNKDALRRLYRRRRSMISPEQRRQKSQMICRLLAQEAVFQNAQVIAFYSSLPEEADLSDLAELALKNGKTAVFPKTAAGGRMDFFRVSDFSELRADGAFGIKEPPDGPERRLLKKEIDLMLVPGICFDVRKNRIGFGGGYYDRYLADAPDFAKAGVCFSEQFLREESEWIDADEQDIKMDLIVTDLEVWI